MIKAAYLIIGSVRFIPHLIVWETSKNRSVIEYDIVRWMQIRQFGGSIRMGFIRLMTELPEFRNLFYKRIGKIWMALNWLAPRMSSLFIYTDDIGPGLFIQHGVATIISAKSIGKDCWINQQVTIGYTSATDCPVIGDNVTISAGAKVIGNVTMGNNSNAGANAVVVKNVPCDCTVVGVPARIIRRRGIRVDEPL